MVTNGLERLLKRFDDSDIQQDPNQRAKLCRLALEKINPRDEPTLAAALLLELAQSQHEIAEHTQDPDLDQLVAALQEAAGLFEPCDDPELYAEIMKALGDAYLDQSRSEHPEILRRSIETYEAALRWLDRRKSPEDWAQIQTRLGLAWWQLRTGDRAENIERALAAYRRALRINTRQKDPIAWALTSMNLGLAYADRAIKRADSLERAIFYGERARDVLPSDDMPIDWAIASMNLALAYWDRLRGNRAENLERALYLLREALPLIDPAHLPFDWASAQNNLGLIYWDRLQGNRADNFERAKNAFESALEVFNLESEPWRWATTTMNLGKVLRERIKGDRSENLEQSLELLHSALEVFSASTVDGARALNHIGAAYFFRLRGDRGENLEKSIAAHHAAHAVLQRESHPFDWALTQNQIARAYSNRIEGDRAENLETAIEAYEAALKVRRRRRLPIEWSLSAMDLAMAYVERQKGDRALNLERALGLLKRVSEIRTREEMPLEWAQVQHNLGFVYSNRLRGRPAWNQRRAILHFQNALEEFAPDTFPADCRHTAKDLADLLASQNRWDESVEIYRIALRALENLYRTALLRSGREAELTDAEDLYRQTALALVKSGHSREAVEVLERGRARGLREALARDQARLQALELREPDLVHSFRKATTRLRHLEEIERRRSSPSTKVRLDVERHRKAARETRQALDQAVVGLRRVDKDFLAEPTFKDIAAALTPNRAVAHVLITRLGTVLLLSYLLRAETVVEPLWAADLTREDLEEFLDHTEADAASRRFTARSLDQMEEILDRVLPIVGLHLIGPLAGRLKALKMEAVHLVAGGALARLPLHAAPYEEMDRMTCLLNEIDTAYSPSSWVLASVKRALKSYPGDAKAAVCLADPKLSFAACEEAALRFSLGDQEDLLMVGQETSYLLQVLPAANHLHLACHGVFNTTWPLESYLEIAAEKVTLRQILSSEPRGTKRLVVLSACETSVTEARQVPDEVIGWPAGFMEIGALGVIGSLWKVDELATVLLMVRFYRLYLAGEHSACQSPMAPARALRRAQLWLRDSTVEDIMTALDGESPLLPPLPPDLAARCQLRLASRALEERPFARFCDWAAFQFTGM